VVHDKNTAFETFSPWPLRLVDRADKMNTVLSQAVFTIPSGAATGQGFINLGILPDYVQAFGRGGAKLLGLKNR
jgi:hypothetical protein